MALIESWADFWSKFARNSLDRVIPGFTEPYVKAWCKVVQKYPNLVGIPFYGRAFVKATCPNLGFPDPPGKGVPPFPDLRCFGVKYMVQIYVDRFFNGQPSPITLPVLTVWGRILDVGIRQDPNISTSFIQAYVSGQNQQGQPFTATASIGGIGVTANFKSYTATRGDGLSLSAPCPIEYPDYDPDPPVDPTDFAPIIKIPIYNTNNIITGFNRIPVIINLNPSLSLGVDMDIGGDKYYFDFSGWNIGDPGNADGGGDRYPDDGGGGSGGGGSGGDNTGTEFDPDALDEEPVPEEEKKINKPGILWAKVIVSTLPTSGKRLVSSSSDDVDHFAGFFSWIIESGGVFRMEEIAIRKRRYMFRAPIGATGVKYYAINGAILSVSVFTLKE